MPAASATELAAAVRSGSLSPAAVVEAYLARIEDGNEELNAYITVIEDEARERAREVARAREAGEELGPLCGVPVALKDLTAFKAGVRHTFGCKAFADYVPDHTVAFVERLEDAGAIVLGKTNTPEFGHRPTTNNLLVGPTANPFDLDANAGGSSGGSAAAVAAGMTALGQGGDAGGSVRIPAALCGVYGIKPTFGRIPNPSRPDAFQNHTPFIDKGPITRTVADAALMLDVITGPHPRDPFSLPDDGTDFSAALDSPVDDLRVAYSPNLDVFPVSEAVDGVVRDAVDTLDGVVDGVEEIDLDLGYSLDELKAETRMPSMELLAAKVARNLRAQHGVDLAGADRDAVPETFRARIESGRAYDALEYSGLNLARTDVLDAILDVFEAYDVLACPTVAVPRVPRDALGPTEIDGEPTDPESDWILTWPFNLTGHPAASIPAGLTDDGFPVGLQLVAPRYDDETLVAVSAAFERAAPWRDSYEDVTV